MILHDGMCSKGPDIMLRDLVWEISTLARREQDYTHEVSVNVKFKGLSVVAEERHELFLANGIFNIRGGGF